MADKHDEAQDDEKPLAKVAAAHPMGMAVGATGAAATGAAVGGGVAGPVGAVVGAAVGAVAGAIGGKAAADSVNPSLEDAWWKEHHALRHPKPGETYETYRPAYEYGWQARMMHGDATWEEIEPNLAAGWPQSRGDSKLEWSEARQAARDAWDKVGPPIGASRTRH